MGITELFQYLRVSSEERQLHGKNKIAADTSQKHPPYAAVTIYKPLGINPLSHPTFRDGFARDCLLQRGVCKLSVPRPSFVRVVFTRNREFESISLQRRVMQTDHPGTAWRFKIAGGDLERQ